MIAVWFKAVIFDRSLNIIIKNRKQNGDAHIFALWYANMLTLYSAKTHVNKCKLF
jgi:hypothetical protein